jgi:hypothetical protein
MKFGFIAKHRGIWPVLWMCGALGVSRGGFYAWLTRPRSQRSREDDELGAKVRASFLGSDRTYGARRVWRSCPVAWCSWGRAPTGVGRIGQLAIAGRLTAGSSLSCAMVSSVM